MMMMMFRTNCFNCFPQINKSVLINDTHTKFVRIHDHEIVEWKRHHKIQDCERAEMSLEINQ